jgi:hypothetical protein
VRLEPGPYSLAPPQLRDVIVDVLNWLGWEYCEDPADQTMRWIPPDAEPLTLALSPSFPLTAATTRLSIDCGDRQEAVARILLDEIHGAIQRRTNDQGDTT